MIRSKKPSLSTERVKKAATRYRPGQQPQGFEQRSDSESDSEDDDQKEDQETKEDQYINEEIVSEDVTSAWAKRRGQESVRRDDREISQEEENEKRASSSDEDKQAFPTVPYRRPFEKSPPAAALPFEEVSEESEESEESSSEEEAEEPYKPVILYKPVFVPKGSRENRAGGVTGQADLDEADLEKRRELEQERRKLEAHELAQQVVEREKLRIKAKNAGSEVALDDTDGLDPDGEYQEWKLRELNRLKRDQEERNARAVEQAQIAARRALPEEVRLLQDLEYAQQTRMSKINDSDTVQSRGAFYRDNLQSIPAKDRSAPSEMETFRKNRLPKSLRGLQSKKSKHA